MVRATKKETTNPRARQACKYDLAGLSPEEFNAIIEGLTLVKGNKTAAALLKTLQGIDTAPRYQNKDTGEVLTFSEMLRQWAEEYDGDDPTNCLGWAEQYEELKGV